MRKLFTLGLVAALSVVASVSFSHAQMMMVPGSFNVSPTGAAEYSIPIIVPPGTAGMEPVLSLNYSSQQGNGLLGVGWSLGGLPSIGRCPQTIAQDGAVRGVRLDGADKFCLDGQRLVAVSGTYGGHQTEYRTEIDGFSKIVSYVDAGSGISGPAYFRVWTKSGQIMDFGTTHDSRLEATNVAVARSWAVSKIADVVGNYLKITYDENTGTGEALPSRIDYTFNDEAGLDGYSYVQFYYEGRPDVARRFIAGAQIDTTKRLKKISTVVEMAEDDDAEGVLDYNLSYQTSPITNRSVLHSVTLCPEVGACLPTTTFGVRSSSFGFDQRGYNFLSGTPSILGSSSHFQVKPADWDGDGLLDIMLWDPSDGDNKWYLARPDQSLSFDEQSFSVSAVNMLNCNSYEEMLFVGNLDGDARPDLLCRDSNGGEVTLHLNRSVPGGLNFQSYPDYSAPYPEDVWLDPEQEVYLYGDDWGVGPEDLGYHYDNDWDVFPADWNGDGLTDLMIANTGTGENHFYLNAGAPHYYVSFHQAIDPLLMKTQDMEFPPADELCWGEDIYEPEPVPCPPVVKEIPVKLVARDFNGDGIEDLYVVRQGYSNIIYFGRGDSNGDGVLDFDAESSFAFGEEDERTKIVDWNGDSQVDGSFFDAATNGSVSIWHHKGDGTVEAPDDFNPIPASVVLDANYNGNGQSKTYYPADMNGDGVNDIIIHDSEKNTYSDGDAFHLFFNTSHLDYSRCLRSDENYVVSQSCQFSGIYHSNIEYEGYFIPADFDNDGITDLMWVRSDTGTHYLYINRLDVPDLIETITTGLGSVTSITYAPGTDSAVYTPETASTWPKVDLRGPIQLVSSVSADNGVGGFYTSDYRYVGGAIDAHGRGFLGFRQFITTDTQTNIEQTLTFRQDFPYIGSLLTDEKRYLPSDILLNQTTHSHGRQLTTQNGADRYFPYVWRTKEESWDLAGPPPYRAESMPTIESTFVFDNASTYGLGEITEIGFGNVVKADVFNTSDASQKTTNSTYLNDTTNWWLGRLLTSEVVSTLSGVSMGTTDPNPIPPPPPPPPPSAVIVVPLNGFTVIPIYE